MTNQILKVLLTSIVLAGLLAGTTANAQTKSDADLKKAIPKGWVQDELFRSIGAVAYRSPDKNVIVLIKDIKKPTKLTPVEWINEYATKKIKGKTVKVRSPAQPNLDHQYPGAWVFTTTVDDRKLKTIKIFAAFIRDDGTVKAGTIIWDNGDEVNQKHTITALKMLGQLSNTSTGKAKPKSTVKTPPKVKEKKEPNPIVAAPGKGISPSEIHGVVHHFGKAKKTFDRKSMFRYTTYPNQGIYLLLKNGWAYKSPDVPPSDLDEEASRRLQPKRWVKWKDDKLLSSLGGLAHKPLKRGHTLDISVSSPSTTIGRVTNRTSWKYLKLTSKGRFETSKTTISNSNRDGHMLGDNQSSTVSSSSKSGQFTAGSTNDMVTGGGAISTVSNNKNGNGSHTGTYFIDGNTIELRYDDGSITRALFGTDGKKYVIMGRTNYWN